MLVKAFPHSLLKKKRKEKKNAEHVKGMISEVRCYCLQLVSLLSSPSSFVTVQHSPVMQETWVPSLSQEDPLDKEMATHSSILAWEIPWTEEPGGLQSMRSQSVRHDLSG